MVHFKIIFGKIAGREMHSVAVYMAYVAGVVAVGAGWGLMGRWIISREAI